ncbi:MAG: type II toxin-antitoxin system prevent-host-death family antitoxin [Rhodococcus sp.]|jgi:antitoxin YefM|nr:type II toxin-antitoxin system prevent-host-death family antitoxin [Rhodococcus sp. (in: high G+C Gram-positive bacteria)]NME79168.1 type II toxin-antitoxin system prevent-host-death family antitoxin [Rhodococcus sp. 105337]
MESAGVRATTVKFARERLGALVREVNDDTVAVEITGKHHEAVLISKKRYLALQEATFLLRSPELMDSLRKEMARSLLEEHSTTAPDGATDKAEKPKTPARRPPRARSRKQRKKKRKKAD